MTWGHELKYIYIYIYYEHLRVMVDMSDSGSLA